MVESDEASVENEAEFPELYERPGFKIRRCHQIASALFVQECADLNLTTTQFGLMMAIDRFAGIDQAGAARVVGLDRSTTATVIDRMVRRGVVRRDADPRDRRRNRIVLTTQGHELLAEAKRRAERARERLLQPLSEGEGRQLLSLLQRILDANGLTTRVAVEEKAGVDVER